MVDPIKEAVANATAKTLAAGKALPEVLKEVPKKKEGTLWPCEPEQLVAWNKEREAKEAESKLFISQLESPLALEATREAGALAAQKKMSMYPRKSEEVSPKKEKETKAEKKAKAPKEGRQNRLGQTKLIDELLKAGKSEAEIIATVKEKIPAYPADKIPKMIKLRQYHVKQA